MYEMIEQSPFQEKNPLEKIEAKEKANEGSAYAILTQTPQKKDKIITDDMIKERLGAEASKVIGWIETLPPELQEQAYYFAITYLEQARISLEEIKRMLEQGIYVSTVEIIDKTGPSVIGEVEALRAPGGKEFYYRGKEIDEVVVAKYGETYVMFEKEDLAQQYQELKEDGYEEVFYVHKEGNKLVVDRLDDQSGEQYLGPVAKSYMWVKDHEGEHVMEFQYVKEGEEIATYYRVNNGRWQRLEEREQLSRYVDEMGRPVSELLSDEEGFLYPLGAFKSTYVNDKKIEGAEEGKAPMFLSAPIVTPTAELSWAEPERMEVENEQFNLMLKGALKKAMDPFYDAEPMSAEEAQKVLASQGLKEPQINAVLWLAKEDSAFLGRMVKALIEEKSEETEVPVLTGKETFQAYLNYLEGNPLEQEINVEELPEAMREEIRKGVEAMKAMDWSLKESEFEKYLAAQMLLNKEAHSYV